MRTNFMIKQGTSNDVTQNPFKNPATLEIIIIVYHHVRRSCISL